MMTAGVQLIRKELVDDAVDLGADSGIRQVTKDLQNTGFCLQEF